MITLLALSFLFLNFNSALAEGEASEDPERAIEYINENIINDPRYKINPGGVHMDRTEDPHNVIAGGVLEEVPGNEVENGEYRYLGVVPWYDTQTEEFIDDFTEQSRVTNKEFPPDALAEGRLEDRNWITEPWTNDNDAVQNAHFEMENMRFNNNPEYEDNIREGLEYTGMGKSLRKNQTESPLL